MAYILENSRNPQVGINLPEVPNVELLAFRNRHVFDSGRGIIIFFRLLLRSRMRNRSRSRGVPVGCLGVPQGYPTGPSFFSHYLLVPLFRYRRDSLLDQFTMDSRGNLSQPRKSSLVAAIVRFSYPRVMIVPVVTGEHTSCFIVIEPVDIYQCFDEHPVITVPACSQFDIVSIHPGQNTIRSMFGNVEPEPDQFPWGMRIIGPFDQLQRFVVGRKIQGQTDINIHMRTSSARLI